MKSTCCPESPKRDRLVKLSSVISVALALVAVAPRASAFVVDDGVPLPTDHNPLAPHLAPHSTVEGKSIAQWGEQWWTWVLSIPNAVNPQLDTAGANAHLGDVGGPVFFVAGNFDGSSERTFSVPSGKFLLLPLVNGVFIPDPGDSLQAAITSNDNFINTVSSLQAVVDGVVITDVFDHRETTTLTSGGFSFTVPDNGLVPTGTYGPTAQDGYWLMLALTQGEHTISFGGTTNSFTNTFSITDHITVLPAAVPIPASLWLLGSAFGLLERRRRISAKNKCP